MKPCLVFFMFINIIQIESLGVCSFVNGSFHWLHHTVAVIPSPAPRLMHELSFIFHCVQHNLYIHFLLGGCVCFFQSFVISNSSAVEILFLVVVYNENASTSLLILIGKNFSRENRVEFLGHCVVVHLQLFQIMPIFSPQSTNLHSHQQYFALYPWYCLNCSLLPVQGHKTVSPPCFNFHCMINNEVEHFSYVLTHVSFSTMFLFLCLFYLYIMWFIGFLVVFRSYR